MIYLDNAATTKIHPEVFDAMIPYLKDNYGNPSSHYDIGYSNKEAIEDARTRIAKTINAEPNEIIFTSGGSESNSLALKQRFNTQTSTFITSEIEHNSIMEYTRKITIPVDVLGYVDLPYYRNAIKFHPNGLVSFQYVNNEIGVIQDIYKLCNIAHNYNSIFHTDAVQAYGHFAIDVKDLDVDLMSVSGHKFGAPKGIGFLYMKKDLTNVEHKHAVIKGTQERGYRGGTENVAYIVGLAKACEIATENININRTVCYSLKNRLLNRFHCELQDWHLNGDVVRVESNINICIDGIDASQLVEYLNEHQVFVSTGSACDSDKNEPSHVLKAIGLSDERAEGSVRITLNGSNTIEEIDYAADCIVDFCKIVRGY